MTKPTTTLFLTTQPDGTVAVSIFENTKAGNPRKGHGLLVTVAPWGNVLTAINPAPDCRVYVRTAVSR